MKEPTTQTLPVFVGRRAELEAIARAIEDKKSCILYFEGDPGIGKTRLLEKAEHLAVEKGVRCSRLVDFYDTALHSRVAIEKALAESLDPESQFFDEYWQKRREFERRYVGTRGPTPFEEEEQETWLAFLKGYTELASKSKRLMLRFDTAELLEYERDAPEVLRICEVPELVDPAWHWLGEWIWQLENTVVLIAARPGKPLREKLENTRGKYPQICLETFELAGLNLEETERYFRESPHGKGISEQSPEVIAKLHLLTEGRPILISLAIDWLARRGWDPNIHSLSLQALREKQRVAEEEKQTEQLGAGWWEWAEIKSNFEIDLVQKIRELESPLDEAARYVARARKGCDARLLSLMMGISQREARQLVEQLLQLSFVKRPRLPRDLFFLHDQMYDLVERHVWEVDYAGYKEQARLAKIIAGDYQKQIDRLEERIRKAKNVEARTRLRDEQQLLLTEQLYYLFDADPRVGYDEYARLDEQAIAAHDHHWDGLLRNETLRFLQGRKERALIGGLVTIKRGIASINDSINLACELRWVKRYVARSDFRKAIRIANKLENSMALPAQRGELLIARGTARAYLGGEECESAVIDLRNGIEIFSENLENILRDQPKRKSYVFSSLGAAYVALGLAYRARGNLSLAVDAYGQATNYYGQVEEKAGRAEALNNLAYIYQRQGKFDRALSLCEEGLQLRQELGDEYGIALSLNTRGIIFERQDHPSRALKSSREALKLFQAIGEERGITLADINMGRALRRIGRSGRGGPSNFEHSVKFLDDAWNRQEKLGASAERYYQIEAQNELGCTYRDWAATLAEKARERDRILILLDSAEKHLWKAIELAKESRSVIQQIDSMEDLARVYYWRMKQKLLVGQWGRKMGIEDPTEAALLLLQEAKKYADEQLKGQEEQLFILGKIHHQYARLARVQGKHDLAAKHYVRAAAYLESYSAEAPELEKTIRDACDWLRREVPEQAGEMIRLMKEQMAKLQQEERLESRKLVEWIMDLVKPSLGVGWPEERGEIS